MFSFTLIVPFFVASLQPALSAAFSWQLTAPPTQCSNLSISVVGSDGQPPYHVLVIPSGPTPLTNNVDPRAVIDQAFDGNSTSISFPINYPANSHFVAVVSDANGFGTGGASVETMVANSDDSSCLNPNQTWSHSFSYGVGRDNQLMQCQPTFIWWTSNALGPVSFVGVIPGGKCFVLPESNISTYSVGRGFTWTPDIQGGTTVMIVGGDNRGMGTAGYAQFTVQQSRNTTCLDSMSPSSTLGIAAGSLQTNTAVSGTGTGSATNGGGGPSVGVTVAAAVGGIIGLITFVVLSYYCLRRHKSTNRRWERRDFTVSNFDRSPSPASPRIRPQTSYTREVTSIATVPEEYQLEPFTYAGVGTYNHGYAYRGQGCIEGMAPGVTSVVPPPPRSRLNSATSGDGAPRSDTSSQIRSSSPSQGDSSGLPQTSGVASMKSGGDTSSQKGPRHRKSSSLSQGASHGLPQTNRLARGNSGGDTSSQKGPRHRRLSSLSQGASHGLPQTSRLASENSGVVVHDTSSQRGSRYRAPSATSSTTSKNPSTLGDAKYRIRNPE